MASTSRSNRTPTITYDVFLSFRGEDTRNNFTDHLYKALTVAGLYTFLDNEEIKIGEELKPEIESAIIKSSASVVILSKQYANSRWCLNELCLILKQMKKCNHFVLPIFYKVTPTDVRNQRGSFIIERSKGTAEDVRRWEAALTEVANLRGMVLSGSEATFITKVVDVVQRKTNSKQMSTPAYFTGMETRVEGINSWLKNEQSNAIALCGMGGSGKTTLARRIYNLNKQDFESTSFIEKEIGKDQEVDLYALQKRLLIDVLGENKIRLSSVSQCTQKIEQVLQTKKLLIVLDGIEDEKELRTLIGPKAFYTQSKIIITTRRLDVHAWFWSISWRCIVHKVKLLNNLESLELLSWHAFRSKVPQEGFEDLARQLAQYCEGNPLALEVLGSSLSERYQHSRKRNNMIEIWKETITSLKSKRDIDVKIQNVLRRSFDSLQRECHKELFLDISCFFVGESKDMVTILREDLYAKSGIKTLINRCLLTVSPDTGELMMHQLLQDMGKRIAFEESKYPWERSRVCNDEESYQVLRKGHDLEKTEGLLLDMLKVEKGMGPEALALKTSSLARMRNLKLLMLKYVKFSGSYKEIKFPELIYLCWHGCTLNQMPHGLLMSSLVAIDMRYGHMETFEVPRGLNSLKILNLEGCYKLVRIHKLHRLPKLEALMLQNCSRLSHLSNSIKYLKSLAKLYLAWCTKLWKASSSNNIHEPLLSLPESLMVLDLGSCDLRYNNDVNVEFRAKSSFNLFLSSNPFKYLPNGIDLKRLRMLTLLSCPNLKSLLYMPSTLEELHVDGCQSLERITFQSGRFSLERFSYEGCSKLSEVQGLFKLVLIAKIDKADLVQHMQWIKEYEDNQVDLDGDEITKGIDPRIQMLYEYGIRSTYLRGKKYQNMSRHTYTSSSRSLFFRVPLHEKKHKIQGLHVNFLYRTTRSTKLLLVKIRNKTKGLTWIYNPVVYCKPGTDVVWLSYWPIGNMLLDVGDKVIVEMYIDHGMIVSECGATLVYMDGDVEEEENTTNEVIGGDLSDFEVTRGVYYLCRRDLFGLETSGWLNLLLGYNIHYPESQGWRKTRQLRMRGYILDFSTQIQLKVNFHRRSEIQLILKEVAAVEGVEFYTVDKDEGRLIVTGRADPVTVAKCATKYGNMAEILSVSPYFRPCSISSHPENCTIM